MFQVRWNTLDKFYLRYGCHQYHVSGLPLWLTPDDSLRLWVDNVLSLLQQSLDPGRLSRTDHPSNHAGKWMYKMNANAFAYYLPRKIIFTHRTGPIHVNSVEAQRELRKNQNDLPLYRILPRLYYSSSVLFLSSSILLFLLLLLLLLLLLNISV